MITSKLRLALFAVACLAALIVAGCSNQEADSSAPATPTADKGGTPSKGAEQAGASSRPAFNMEDQK